jgi:hypothetical protein
MRRTVAHDAELHDLRDMFLVVVVNGVSALPGITKTEALLNLDLEDVLDESYVDKKCINMLFDAHCSIDPKKRRIDDEDGEEERWRNKRIRSER